MFETFHEALVGNARLANMSLKLMVDASRNLEELSDCGDPEEQNLRQRERIGRQPVTQHRLQIFHQSTTSARESQTAINEQVVREF